MQNIVYANPRSCHGLIIPLRIQTKLAKDFCQENKLDFSLPTTESWSGNRLDILENIFEGNNFNLITLSELFLCSRNALDILEEQDDNKSILIITSYEGKKYTIKEMKLFIKSFLKAKKYRLNISNLLEKDIFKQKNYFNR